MSEPAHEAHLIDEAIDLAIRLQSAPDNPVAQDMVRAWRTRSPAHEAAWARVARVHGASGKVLTERRNAERRADAGMSRRTLVLGGLAGLGVAATGALLAPELMLRARADHMTAKGEIRQLDLPGIGAATLGPDSALALEIGPAGRRATLISGMAFMEVAPDPHRPFTLAAGDLTATLDSGALDISSDAGVLSLGLAEGAARAHLPGARPQDTVELGAGDWLAFSEATRRVERGHRDRRQIASWRDNQIVAERDAVATLTARIGRWLPGRILITDRRISNAQVSGVFDLADPLGALEAVVQPTGARVRRIGSLLTVVSYS
ncbi:FecR family protein [Xanthobacteraceae bacterium A53D]